MTTEERNNDNNVDDEETVNINNTNRNNNNNNNEIIISATAVEIEEAPRANGIEIASASALIEVIAPATLAEGYTFRAQLGGSRRNNRMFDVTVPEGGVEIGQRFLVPWPTATADNFHNNLTRHNSITSSTITMPASNVPTRHRVGRWKDGLCSCYKHGCCHAMLWNTICFPLIAISQVMTRLDLSLLGKPASSNKTFSVAIFITFFLYLLLTIDTTTNAIPYMSMSAYALFSLLVLHTTIVTRKYIRMKYSIPSTCCGECEDVCCAFWCNCCVITQMARHTTDYSTYTAYCCTNTGLPPGVAIANDHIIEPLL